jgi:polyhydroxyalkanoate synthase
VRDLERGKGRLSISMTDYDAFQVGENIAVTPGKVIFQNRMMQLIQYTPTTEKVFRRPLLIMPPWINKFYIMDLKPQNSLVRWLVAEGHTVFMVSWVNPDESYKDVDFEDYMTEGPLAALDAIEQATGERDVNAIGYCIGGTLLASTLAYMAVKNDTRIKSATFFTAMTEFSEIGEMSVFIDEEQLELLKTHMAEKGYLEAHHMEQVFNMMRERDLIWSFVVNNYLLGRDPMAFDLLYWNSDATRMPAKMHQFYLRNMYLENRLAQPGGIEMKGVPIDLRKIKIPVYQVSTREDHIAPWKATYALSQMVAGPYQFVLAGSGHIAGVINPPPSTKYGYWTNDNYPADRDAWLAAAAHHEGSWWPNWAEWAAKLSADKVPARTPGAGKLKAIEDAPGSYVKARIE